MNQPMPARRTSSSHRQPAVGARLAAAITISGVFGHGVVFSSARHRTNQMKRLAIMMTQASATPLEGGRRVRSSLSCRCGRYAARPCSATITRAAADNRQVSRGIGHRRTRNRIGEDDGGSSRDLPEIEARVGAASELRHIVRPGLPCRFQVVVFVSVRCFVCKLRSRARRPHRAVNAASLHVVGKVSQIEGVMAEAGDTGGLSLRSRSLEAGSFTRSFRG